jgi:hypothetical protein
MKNFKKNIKDRFGKCVNFYSRYYIKKVKVILLIAFQPTMRHGNIINPLALYYKFGKIVNFIMNIVENTTKRYSLCLTKTPRFDRVCCSTKHGIVVRHGILLYGLLLKTTKHDNILNSSI